MTTGSGPGWLAMQIPLRRAGGRRANVDDRRRCLRCTRSGAWVSHRVAHLLLASTQKCGDRCHVMLRLEADGDSAESGLTYCRHAGFPSRVPLLKVPRPIRARCARLPQAIEKPEQLGANGGARTCEASTSHPSSRQESLRGPGMPGQATDPSERGSGGLKRFLLTLFLLFERGSGGLKRFADTFSLRAPARRSRRQWLARSGRSRLVVILSRARKSELTGSGGRRKALQINGCKNGGYSAKISCFATVAVAAFERNLRATERAHGSVDGCARRLHISGLH